MNRTQDFLSAATDAIAVGGAVAILVDSELFMPLMDRLATVDKRWRFLAGEVPTLCGVPLIRYPMRSSWSVHIGEDGAPLLRQLAVGVAISKTG